MKNLRIGVIGLGLGRLHVDQYLANPSVEAVVICDPDEERRATVLAQSDRVTVGYARPEDMLRSEKLDAVSVVTPDHMHRAHAELCFDAGAHVLLTKPIATNHSDAAAIVRAAHQTGQKLMVAQECRFRSRFQFLKGLISSGALGEIINIRIDSIWDKREQFKRAPWYASEENGRSIMVGTAIHEVDLLRFLVGKRVTAVGAFGNSLGSLSFPSEKTVSALFQFSNGGTGQVTASYEARWPAEEGRRDQLRILGTSGAVIGDEYITDAADHWQQLPTDGNEFLTGVNRSVSSFVESLETDQPVEVTGEDALRSLELCLAVDRAIRSGALVRLDAEETAQ